MSFYNQQQQQQQSQHLGGAIELGPPVSATGVEERAKFIERTYLHLAGAILGFVGIEFVLLSSEAVTSVVANTLFSETSSRYTWLVVLGAFMAVSYVADKWARSATSLPLQYAGLSLYVIAEALIFVPLLMIAQAFSGPENPIIFTAGVSTMAIFAALTGIVLYTKKDFSWMRGALGIVGLSAAGLIVASIVFGFSLGIFFTVLMIAFAACYILYDTSNVLHHYRTDQYVAASLKLFASVALLFWYVIRFFMQFRN